MTPSSARAGGEPAVSVVVPVRDGELYLAEALASALAQTHAPLEVLVVDDGSTDGTAAVAAGFGPPVRVVAQAPAGPGAARNRGVAAARGEVVAFLDADDVWAPEKLERQLAALAADPEAELVFGHMVQFRSPDLDPVEAARIACPAGAQPAAVSSALLVRRETCLRVGPFGTGGQADEFLSWLLRAEELGLRRVVVPDVVLRRRLHASNFHRREPRARAGYARALKESLDRRRGSVA